MKRSSFSSEQLLHSVKRVFSAGVLGLLSTSFCMQANAVLIDRGVTTYDTDSGLSWLDLSETTGLIPQQVSANVNGLLDAGWSVATGSQVDDLFRNAGAVGDVTNGVSYSDTSVVDLLLSLLGQTADSPLGQFGQGWAENAPGLYSQPFYLVDQQTSRVFGSGNTFPFTQPSDSSGLFLIRAEPVSTPGTIALLAASVLLLGRRFTSRATV